MPQALCRCGQPLPKPDATGRVVCPSCGARVRVRVRPAPMGDGDGFIRFACSCGRRLKVPAANRPEFGQCPDCGRIVPIPEAGQGMPAGHPETPTADLDPSDVAALERWVAGHQQRRPAPGDPAPAPAVGMSVAAAPASSRRQAEEPDTTLSALEPAPAGRVEAGLRTCPRCGRPVHLQAESCRACGAAVPRR